MEEMLREAVMRSPADYTEVRWEEVERSRVAFQRDQLMALEATKEAGGIVRALMNGAWGIAVPSLRARTSGSEPGSRRGSAHGSSGGERCPIAFDNLSGNPLALQFPAAFRFAAGRVGERLRRGAAGYGLQQSYDDESDGECSHALSNCRRGALGEEKIAAGRRRRGRAGQWARNGVSDGQVLGRQTRSAAMGRPDACRSDPGS